MNVNKNNNINININNNNDYNNLKIGESEIIYLPTDIFRHLSSFFYSSEDLLSFFLICRRTSKLSSPYYKKLFSSLFLKQVKYQQRKGEKQEVEDTINERRFSSEALFVLHVENRLPSSVLHGQQLRWTIPTIQEVNSKSSSEVMNDTELRLGCSHYLEEGLKKNVLLELCHYEEGVREGSHKKFWCQITKTNGNNTTLTAGTLKRECTWRKGLLYGKYISYHSNGAIRHECEYNMNGQKEGEEKYWFSNSVQSVSSYYVNGKREGQVKLWWRNGTLRGLSNWKEGSKNGNEHFWHDNGVLSREICWRNGKRHGTLLTYYYEGSKMSSCSFTNGKADGPAKLFKVGNLENGQQAVIINQQAVATIIPVLHNQVKAI